MAETFSTWIRDFLETERILALTQSAVLLVAGLILGRLAAGAMQRFAGRRLDASQALLARRITYYVIVGLFLATALRNLGFDLGVLAGAAGIVTVALGFASQTSASNLISGLFLIGERPFAVGDLISVGTTTGEVLSIDFLSVKLRQFDNVLVRIPNEALIKTEVKTLTRFPIRRLDLAISVAYKESLERVRGILLALAERNPLSLEDPKPLLILQGFGPSGIDIQFSIWVETSRFLDLRNSIMEEIKQAFDDEGIEIPFPHLSLYSGSATEPLPIRLVGGRDDPPQPERSEGEAGGPA